MNTIKAIAVETIVIDSRSARLTRLNHQVVCVRCPSGCLKRGLERSCWLKMTLLWLSVCC